MSDSDLARYIARQQRRDAAREQAAAAPSSGGGGITRATVEALVLKATDPLLIGPDYTTVLLIGDILQRKPKWTDTVTDAVKERLKVREKDVQMRCAELLEACVKNVPASKTKIGSKDFLAQLKKVASAKDTDLEVKNKLLDLIQAWAEEFPSRRDYAFSNVYEAMKRKGITFPPSTRPVNTHYEAPRGDSSRDNKRASKASLGVVENNAELLREMLAAIDPKTEDVSKNDIVQELLSSCKAAHPGLKQIIESGKASESQLERALVLNDKLVWINEAYAELLKGKRPALPQEQQSTQSSPRSSDVVGTEIADSRADDEPLPSLARAPPRARGQPPSSTLAESVFSSPPRPTPTAREPELDEFDLLARRHTPSPISTTAPIAPFPASVTGMVSPTSTPLDDPFAALVLRPSPAPPVNNGIDFLFRDSSVSTPPPTALGFSPLSSPLLQPVPSVQSPLAPVPMIPTNVQQPVTNVYTTTASSHGKESLI